MSSISSLYHYINDAGLGRVIPLSAPLSDLLQSIVNRAFQQGLLHLTIPARDGAGFPIVQYADYTILILKASQRELHCLSSFGKLLILYWPQDQLC
jgi:hypothetical protein